VPPQAGARRDLAASDAVSSPAACRSLYLGPLRSVFDAVRGGSSRSECRHAFARGPHFKVESCQMNLRR